MRLASIFLALGLLCSLLAGCAADGGARSAEDEPGDGPRLYGELNQSIDYVDVR